MTLTIDLPPQTEAWISSEAEHLGVPPEDVARRILNERAAAPPTAPFVFPPTGRASAHLRARIVNEATSDPEKIRKAQEELDEMKQSMNEERRRAGAEPIF